MKLLQQIGLELAFVDPVQENGIAGLQTPITALPAAVGGDAPEPVLAALAAARRWLDERAAADGKLTDDVIAKLKEWHPWLISAVDAWEQGTEPPAIPAWLAPAKSSHASPARAAEAPEVPDQLVEISIGDGDAEMLQLFCAEAQDLLQDIEQGVLVLESNPKDSTTIDTVFRAFHTFKGNVGVMKLVVLQQLTHELESLLDAARRGTFQLGRESIDVILAGEDVLKRYVEEMSGQLSGGSRSTKVAFPIPSHHRGSARPAGSKNWRCTRSEPAASSTASPCPGLRPRGGPGPRRRCSGTGSRSATTGGSFGRGCDASACGAPPTARGRGPGSR